MISYGMRTQSPQGWYISGPDRVNVCYKYMDPYQSRKGPESRCPHSQLTEFLQRHDNPAFYLIKFELILVLMGFHIKVATGDRK